MREIKELIDKYLSKNSNAIVYYNLEQDKFNKVIENIGGYEKPDILSIFDNEVVAIEHFEFDSYKRSRKGSDFKIQHNNMEKDFNKKINEKLKTQKEVIVHGQIQSSASAHNYFNNFKTIFLSHYKKIDSYTEHIKKDFPDINKLTYCFFAEDVTPLGNYFMDRKTSNNPYLLNPLCSDEIIEILKQSPKVKYLIVGCYALSEYKLMIFENKLEALEIYKKERPNFNIENYLCFAPKIAGFTILVPNEEREKKIKDE